MKRRSPFLSTQRRRFGSDPKRRPWLVVLVLLAGLVLALPAARAEEIDLAKVEGVDAFPGGEAERALLAKNGFVVLPRFHRQIFSLYIGGSLPYYITTDSAHHTYHVLFESVLKDIERGAAAKLRAFLDALHRIQSQAAISSGDPSGDGRALAVSHVAVAARLLGLEAEVPPGLADVVAAEVELVTASAGPAPSPLFGTPEDYALYAPRGFYAGDPLLEAYFRAATWLGRRGFRIRDERETWAALHLVRTIQSDQELRTALAGLSSFLDWMLGPPDDLTVAEYAETIVAVLGTDRSDAALATRFADLREALGELRAPEINAQVLKPSEWERFREETKGLRLLPSRRTPDAWLFQQLIEEAPRSGLPSGLEVAGALGSKRALGHRAAAGPHPRQRAGLVTESMPGFRARRGDTHYGATLEATALLFDGASPLCSGSAGPGADGTVVFPPSLFGSGAWNDRLLTTGLSSWTSLRHAWVLHAKTTMYALGLTDDPAGVVEPAPRFYAALAGLSRSLVERGDAIGGFAGDGPAVLAKLLPVLEKYATGSFDMEDMELLQEAMLLLETNAEGLETMCRAKGHPDPDSGRACIAEVAPRLRAWLEGRGALDEAERAFVAGLSRSDVRSKLLLFATLMDDLERISQVELRGEALSAEDAELIRHYGKAIASLNFFGGNSWLEPEKQMGLVVNVAVDPEAGTYLETAVGAAMELYVSLPIRGGSRRLYQGGVYAWYEFPSSRPTTDREWIERVKSRRTPALPAWTRSYVAEPDETDVVTRVQKGEVVEAVEDVSDPAIGAALLDHLENGRHETGEQDRHLAWVAVSVRRYADTELRPRIVEALLQRVVNARDEVHRAHHGPVFEPLGQAAAYALSQILRPEDYPRLLALLRSPPAGAAEGFAERVVEALTMTRDPAIGKEADALIQDADADVRRTGLELRVAMGHGGASSCADVVNAVMAYLERAEDDEQRKDALGHIHFRIEEYGPHFGAEHAGILSDLLASKDPDLVGRAVGAWGYAVGMRPDGDPYRVEAADWLEKRLRRGPWRVSTGCLDGLGGLRTQEALDALARIARDPNVDVDLRQLAIAPLARQGEPALPHLFRLCFDDTETGDSVNDHELRIADEAAKEVDRLLGYRFRYDESVPYADKRVPALESIRAEARMRGYGP